MDSIKTDKNDKTHEIDRFIAADMASHTVSGDAYDFPRGRGGERKEGDIWLTPHSKYGMGSFAAAAAPPFAPDDDDDVVNKYTAIANDVDSTRTEPKLQVAEKSHESG